MRQADPASGQRHIVFVQFGDYAEAVHRFSDGGGENYYAQKYTVDHVSTLTARHGRATVVCFSRAYGLEMLANGVGAAGVLLC
jgi:hypothetical protein